MSIFLLLPLFFAFFRFYHEMCYFWTRKAGPKKPLKLLFLLLLLSLLSKNQSINQSIIYLSENTKSKHARNKTIKDVKCFGQRRA